MSRRLAALLALLAAAVALVAAVLALITDPLSVVIATVFLLIGIGAGWTALTHRGPRRTVALVALVAAMAGGLAAILLRGAREAVVLAVALLVYGAAARRATRPDASSRPPGRRPRTAGAVLLVNPRSGDGRAGRANLTEEARARGIRAIELQAGQDLRALAEEAAETARVIGMAGGDGSQALVAEVAMRHELPYVCIPAGTRNHFALDLGLDPSDLVGCLEAFDADQAVHRVIDLAMVATACSSTTCRWAPTPSRSRSRATARRSCGRWPGPHLTRWRSTRRRSTSGSLVPTVANTHPSSFFWSRTTPTGSTRPGGSGRGPGSTRARWGSWR
ncbi:MAG TPA: acylglycerol kinase family protein [Gaiellales bacterium]|nr:acylglycerol kinase family protein [Gaiellales bacterium]